LVVSTVPQAFPCSSHQDGNLGLLHALDTFPANSTITFSNHAATCTEQAISEAIAASRSRENGNHERGTDD
jgi:hypothetical protein